MCAQAQPDSPERFRVEMLFSNGANYDPTDEAHAMCTKPRVPIHRDNKLWLQDVQAHLTKWGTHHTQASSTLAVPQFESR